MFSQATFTRNQNEGRLIIDNGRESFTAVAGGRTKTVEINAPYYIGGLPLDVATAAATINNIEVRFFKLFYFWNETLKIIVSAAATINNIEVNFF